MTSLVAFLDAMVRNASILLDDVVALAKPAVKKAAAVVVDDTAVSSDQLNAGAIAQHREYVVWGKIVLASLINKGVILFLIVLFGAIAPIVPQVMLGLGAAYLALEGAHKVFESANAIFSRLARRMASAPLPVTLSVPARSMSGLPFFVRRFLGADPKEQAVLLDLILLDAILSTEILLVANGSLGAVSLFVQVAALMVVGVVTTMGVYGIVLLIVRADNLALLLLDEAGRVHYPSVGRGILLGLPHVLRLIGLVGTAAMLGVAGEVLGHLLPDAFISLGLEGGGHAFHGLVTSLNEGLGHAIGPVVVGFLLGAAIVGAMVVTSFLRGQFMRRPAA